jgi:hypothetical protein
MGGGTVETGRARRSCRLCSNGDAVRFTAPSGARVFASGAQQFACALDDWRSDG